jgi:hypothetical protein
MQEWRSPTKASGNGMRSPVERMLWMQAAMIHLGFPIPKLEQFLPQSYYELWNRAFKKQMALWVRLSAIPSHVLCSLLGRHLRTHCPLCSRSLTCPKNYLSILLLAQKWARRLKIPSELLELSSVHMKTKPNQTNKQNRNQTSRASVAHACNLRLRRQRSGGSQFEGSLSR